MFFSQMKRMKHVPLTEGRHCQQAHVPECYTKHRGSANHPARQRHAAFTPEFPSPIMARTGLTQTHVPPRQHKTAWHSDITHVISPHGVPRTEYNHVKPSTVGTANHPAPHRHSAFTPTCFPSPNGTDSRKRKFHQVASSEATPPRSCLPDYIGTTEWPVLLSRNTIVLYCTTKLPEATAPRSCCTYKRTPDLQFDDHLRAQDEV